MKTPVEIISILHNGLSSFYNESIPLPLIIPANSSTIQAIIGWNHLARERISKSFTKCMHKFYSTTKISSFSGNGWTKEVIEFLVSTHIDAWKTTSKSKSRVILSLEHQSLLITVDSLFEKVDSFR